MKYTSDRVELPLQDSWTDLCDCGTLAKICLSGTWTICGFCPSPSCLPPTAVHSFLHMTYWRWSDLSRGQLILDGDGLQGMFVILQDIMLLSILFQTGQALQRIWSMDSPIAVAFPKFLIMTQQLLITEKIWQCFFLMQTRGCLSENNKITNPLGVTWGRYFIILIWK